MSLLAETEAGVITAAQCRSLGVDSGELRALLRSPRWTRLRRGVYADLTAVPGLELIAVNHHRQCAALLAALDRSAGNAVISHLSAVRLLGLPIPPYADLRTTITRRPPGPPAPVRGGVVHVAQFDDHDVIDVGGLPVLAGARLVIDCCTTMPPESALAVADAAMARGLVTREDLLAGADAHAGRPYAQRVRLITARADALAENWFESASRWWLMEAGLPRPELQVPFTDENGRVRARVDMLFRDEWTVGEADGRGKYTSPEVLYAEKLREDWLRDGPRLEVVRWTPADLRSPGRRDALTERVRAAFRRSRH
jgi:hypothetical protein